MKKPLFNTPILFLVFNRPDITRNVFSEIQKLKPLYLYIAADGPRKNKPDDIEKCRQTREILNLIDWPCEVKTLFREKNLGCKIAVSSAIDWFFEHVTEGIILEDDCLPDYSFFIFCGEMLQKYRNNEKVMMIGGSNFRGFWDTDYSYFFSHYARLWGWATWKRVWDKYDVTMSSWTDRKNKKIIKRAINDMWYWKEKKWVYDQVFLDKKDTWDYQMEYLILLNGGLTVVPKVNLIQNIGFRNDATHTFLKNPGMSVERKFLPFPILHPTIIDVDKEYDRQLIPKTSTGKIIFRKIFGK